MSGQAAAETAATSDGDSSKLQVQYHNPPNIHAPAPTYSHIATVPISDNVTFATFAGQIGMDPNGNVPSNYHRQVEIALENLDKCLASVGCGPDSIVRLMMFVVGLGNEENEKIRKSLYRAWLGGRTPPPDTLIGVAALATPDLLFEIEATVIVRR